MPAETVYRIILVLILVISMVLGILLVNAVAAEVREFKKKRNGQWLKR